MKEENKRKMVETIEESGPWERISTNIEGVSIVKPPEYNNKQQVFIEIIPSSNGHMMKKKGIYLKSVEELEVLNKITENPKTKELLEVIEEYYGKEKRPKIEI